MKLVFVFKPLVKYSITFKKERTKVSVNENNIEMPDTMCVLIFSLISEQSNVCYCSKVT